MVRYFSGIVLAAAAFSGVAFTSTTANAEYLYWGYSGVANRPLCFQQLEQAARAIGLNNIRVQPNVQVSGGLNDNHTYAVLTCAPNGDQVLALVMVAADEANNAESTREAIQNYITSLNGTATK